MRSNAIKIRPVGTAVGAEITGLNLAEPLAGADLQTPPRNPRGPWRGVLPRPDADRTAAYRAWLDSLATSTSTASSPMPTAIRKSRWW